MKTKNLSCLSVGGVLCISLKDRHDRRERLLQEFKHSWLNIEFILVEPDEVNPERGCFESHLKCASMALERNYAYVLILEDDATLLPFSTSKIHQLNDFLSRKKPDLLYLGATLGKLWLTWDRGIARVRTKGAYAYVLSRDGCKKLLSFAPYSGMPIDHIYSKKFKGYGVFPFICQHQPESVAKSNIAPYRSGNQLTEKEKLWPDEQFWQSNWRRQYRQAAKNMAKTLIRKDM